MKELKTGECEPLMTKLKRDNETRFLKLALG